MTYTATYSPEDNKIRLYASTRLDPETYARVRAAGFIWAPKQDLFVAPMWTPEREDIATELAGEIGDEDTSLVDRAEERAERFEGYSERRADDAERAREHVASIADGIPLGQPILVGHHSERHARKDAERIENGMRKAVKMWQTSKYWTSRAAGAIRHAKYKELPGVRARRIKGLEADERKQKRTRDEVEARAKLWANVLEPGWLKNKDTGEVATAQRAATWLAGRDRFAGVNLYSDLEAGRITPEDAQAQRLASCAATIARCDRWLEHIANRLTYERAMLDASGYTPPPKPKTKADLPLLNYGGTVAYRNPWQRGEIVRSEAHGMTRAEYAAINKDYKGTRVSECGTHRVRTALVGRGSDRGLCIVYLTDSKQHPRPSTEAVEAAAAAARAAQEAAMAERLERAPRPAYQAPERTAFDDMADSLKHGVQTVSAPQLFPTPVDVAARMVELAGVAAGSLVLEPSAGTGRLIDAAQDAGARVVAIEHSHALADQLSKRINGHAVEVHQGDFLTCEPGSFAAFDCVVMNPPFKDAEDVKHIMHARRFLKPGGVLVALCANGPRQAARLQPLADSWELLPPGTFAAQGTGVNVVLLTMRAD